MHYHTLALCIMFPIILSFCFASIIVTNFLLGFCLRLKLTLSPKFSPKNKKKFRPHFKKPQGLGNITQKIKKKKKKGEPVKRVSPRIDPRLFRMSETLGNKIFNM